MIPPASALNYVPWAIIGFIFQYVIRRRHFSYWAKYNCTWYQFFGMTALVTLGCLYRCIICCARCWDRSWFVTDLLLVGSSHTLSQAGVYMLIFKTSLQYPLNGNIGLNTIQKWWGNQVFKDTLDWKFTPLRKLEEGATFGCNFFFFFDSFMVKF